MVTTCQVKFNGYGTIYSYLTRGLSVRIGDTVIVDSPSTGYTALKVISVDTSSKATVPIVDVVNDASYKLYKLNETKRKEIKRKLDERLKSRNELLQYRYLAGVDPEAAKLLRELEALG